MMTVRIMARGIVGPWGRSALGVIGLLLCVSSPVHGDAFFFRGDANRDGTLNITDPILTLGFLFGGTPGSLGCMDAADANDDGTVNVADAVRTLNYLFARGELLPLPGTDTCGPDPTADELDCAEFDAELCRSSELSAEVLTASASGEPLAYTFRVTVRSPDTGCDQYADWWEVVTPEGSLVYRRVLGHSHVTEQPFTRTGGPVAIAADDEVIVRAHMNNHLGYGHVAVRGSPATGFAPTEVSPDFAAELATEEPLPTGCPF